MGPNPRAVVVFDFIQAMWFMHTTWESARHLHRIRKEDYGTAARDLEASPNWRNQVDRVWGYDEIVVGPEPCSRERRIKR